MQPLELSAVDLVTAIHRGEVSAVQVAEAFLSCTSTARRPWPGRPMSTPAARPASPSERSPGCPWR
jgi:hypothetical protein